MAEIVVREAVGVGDMAAVRRLLQAYGEYLAANPTGAANICIEGYAEELERLSDNYAVLLLVTVDGTAAGCVALRRIPADAVASEMKKLWVVGPFRGLSLRRRRLAKASRCAEQIE